MAHILILGLGELGGALAQALLADGHQVSGIRRGAEAPDGVTLYAQDVLAGPVTLPAVPVDLLYVIMTPSGRDEAGYEQAYLEAPHHVLEALAAQQALPPVIFVSSTSVYGDLDGRVDEDTAPQPSAFNGRIVLAAEQAIAARALSTAVRFSGIYGPGRGWMPRLAAAIAAGETSAPAPGIVNHIHSADCVGMLHHLGQRWLVGDPPPAVVVGTDALPVVNAVVLNWLGGQAGAPLGLPEPAGISGRAMYSRYIEQGHYRLRYPDYRTGYPTITPA